METCYKCEADVNQDDKFCRECGTKAPSRGVSWDWKDQPDFGRINELLQPYGAEIEEVETGTDQHAIRVRDLVLKSRFDG